MKPNEFHVNELYYTFLDKIFYVLGKFRKMYKNKRTTDLLKEIEANETSHSNTVVVGGGIK